ncbi:MAG: hypothetical protein PBV01_10155 [Brucella anthropi]
MTKHDGTLKEPAVDPLFAKRMEVTLDNHPRAPGLMDGRLTWLMRELKTNGADVTLQSVHRWYHGHSRPRNKKLTVLAKVLGVDPAWLLSGNIPEIDGALKQRLQVMGDGLRNCLIGFIQLAGWQCAIPEVTDEAAAYVDFYAIIKGRQHRVHVSSGTAFDETGTARFTITNKYEKCSVVGVTQTEPFKIDALRFPTEIISKYGEQVRGSTEIVVRKRGGEYHVGPERIDLIENFNDTFLD